MRNELPDNRSLGTFLRLPGLIAAIALVTVVTWLIGWRYVEQSLLRTAGEALALGASDIAVQLDRLVFERYADMRIMSAVLAKDMKRDVPAVQAYLNRMHSTYGIYHWLGVADAGGRIIASSSPGLIGTDVSRAPWFLETKARALSGRGAAYLGGVEAFVTEKGAPDSISFSAAIYDGRGAFHGVMSSRVSIPRLESIATETIHSIQARNSALANVEYQILDNEGTAYIDSDLSHKGLVNLAALSLPSVALSRTGRSGFVEEDHQRRGVRVLTGYSQTRGWNQEDAFRWTVLVRMPTAALVAPVRAFHLKIGAAGLAILLPILGLLIWMQRRLQKAWRIAQREHLLATSAQAQYHLLLQTTDQGIFGLDEEGRCTFVNRAAARMLGYEPEEPLGERLHERLHGEESRLCAPERCVLAGALIAGRSARLTEQTFRRKDGALFDVECSAFPLIRTGGRTEFVFTFMDIAERKQRTQALLHYQARLQSLAVQLRKTEESARQRLATELHDNLAQTLALCQMKLASVSRALPPAGGAAVAPVAALIKEALAATRQLMSELQPPMLGDEGDLAAAVQWVTAKLERHGLAVRIVDDRKPKPLDPEVLRIAHQSLHELLFNVLKHARTTAATVRLRRFGAFLALQVGDRGAGFQTGVYKAPTQDGGFGLFNVREQLRGVGGHIRVSSSPGRGSRVTILLPLRAGPLLSAPTAEERTAAGRVGSAGAAADATIRIRLLLVDDHQIMREGLRSMLEGEPGFEVVAEALDGEMAVDLAARLRPDVILMDINMPKLNGVEATRRITQSRPAAAIIGLSMHEDPQLEHLMYQAGAAAYLSKGTAFNLVCDAIRRVASARRPAARAQQAAADHQAVVDA